MTGLDASAAEALRQAVQAGAAPIETCAPEAAQQDYLQGFAATLLPLELVAQTAEFWVDGARLKLWRGQGRHKARLRRCCICMAAAG
ncbi:MAG: hypothetical protein ABIR04_06220 [Cypionkella sp.]